MLYKISIKTRQYDEFSLYDAENLNDVPQIEGLDPISMKLFNHDIFRYSDSKIEFLHSTVRSSPIIPGILVIDNDKRFGTYKNKYLYKCIPDDKRIPVFLVPYLIKSSGFSKKVVNKYVSIKYQSWDDKHPRGTIVNTIGDVSELSNFYEYQLYCKSLYASIQPFTKKTKEALKLKSHGEFIQNIIKKHNVEDRKDEYVFTIDPLHSKDLDDGFGIKECDNGNAIISIYISNVALWIDELKIWNSFSKRISTIYLPDKKRPMLPTILSECLCSLLEHEDRLALCMDVTINDKGDVIDVKYKNTLINVNKNFRYEEKELDSNKHFKLLLERVKTLNRKFKYIDNIRNSHDIVTYLMILMNFISAKKCFENKCGLFRSVKVNIESSNVIPDSLPQDVSKFIKIWSSSSGQYNIFSDQIKRHELMDFDSYIHITSPIRRLVDLLNLIEFQRTVMPITLSDSAKEFFTNWTSTDSIEYINKTTRVIKKIQCSCGLLDLCTKNPSTLEKHYDGYLFDKLERNDGLFQYVTYIPEIKMITKYISRFEINNYSKALFQLYLFNDEHSLKKKIRVNLISEKLDLFRRKGNSTTT